MMQSGLLRRPIAVRCLRAATISSRRLVAVLAFLAAGSCSRGPALPPVITETTTFDFQVRFSEAAVVQGRADRKPSSSYLLVGTKKAQLAEGGSRPAILLPPPAEVAFDVAVPSESSVLRFALGLEFKSDVDPAKVKYEVLIDGARALSEELAQARKNPEDVNWAVDWKEIEIPLAAHVGRRVRVTFKTELIDGPAEKPVGAGFAIARVIQKAEIARRPASEDEWNVVIALVDTTRADHLSAYGYGRPTTPHLETLAKEGVLYTNAISQSSWTWPATTSFLTSRYPHAHGVLDDERCYLDDSIETMSEAFQGRGYTTYGISANALICKAQNFNQGFERFVEAFRWTADRVTDDFLSWLDGNEKHAFFAYLHYMDPHHPYTPPEKTRLEVAPDMFGADDQETLLKIRDGQKNMRDVQKLEALRDHVVALYDAEIRHWDNEFARLVDSLRTRGVLDRTIIVVTSDHGEEFWEHGHIGHAKTLYQELIRVPLVVWAPRLAKPARVDGLVETMDVFPTLCEALGLNPPREMQGRRLPGLSGVRPPEKSRDEAYSTTELAWVENEGTGDKEEKVDVMEFRSQEALVGPRMKLIRQQADPEKPERRDLLFDLEKDPAEKDNLAREKAAFVAEIALKIEAWVRENSKLAPDTGSLTGDGRGALEAMGYVGKPKKVAPPAPPGGSEPAPDGPGPAPKPGDSPK